MDLGFAVSNALRISQATANCTGGRTMTDDEVPDDEVPLPEIIECPFCEYDSRLADPHTQSRLSFVLDKETPCGKKYRQWVHMGCAQEYNRTQQ